MVSVSQKLRSALSLHQSGELDQAENLYRDIIRLDPRHADALHLLGVTALQQSRPACAVDCISRAIAVDNKSASYHSNLGAAYRAMGEREKAVKSFRQAVRLNPDFADAHYNLGTLFQEQGKSPEAIASLRRAIRLNPTSAEAQNNLGMLLAQQGKHEEAAECYLQALEIDPRHCQFYNNLGTVLEELHKHERAARCYRKAIELNPGYAEAHFNLGNIFRNQEALNNAEICYRRALELNPQSAAAYVNLGMVHKDQGKLSEAIACNDRAIEIDADHVEAHINRSFVRRLKGDLQQGWAEFEWRWREEDIPDRFAGPLWDGSSLAGKSILIYAEQGVGDEIMFSSCIPEVAGEAANCFVDCDPRLIPLFARSFPNTEPIPTWDASSSTPRPAIPEYDYRIAMGSLLQFTRPTLNSFPRHTGYLVADGNKQRQWQERLSQLGEGIKIGISWRGGKRTELQRRRTTGTELWSRILTVPGVHFVNLQYGDCREEIAEFHAATGTTIHDWDDSDPMTDLDGFAAQIAALDLVISIDNSTVHMAGALNVPVWNMIPFSPDWRWQMDRDDTLWYPSMRLFRQPQPGDWDSVFQQVSGELHKQAAGPEKISHNESERSENDSQWLSDNFYLRMDANQPIFPISRREFHLSRYEFARQFCVDKRVLDAACGTGYGSALLGKVAREVDGVDIDSKTVGYATRAYGSQSIRFARSPVEMTRFDADRFDVVTSFETIEHLIAPQAALAEFVRVLRTDGTAILSIPNAWGLTPYHFTDFNFTALRDLLEQFFQEQEFYYNNSGDKADRNLKGIGPLNDISAEQAECILAVCKRPRKERVVSDRMECLLDETYRNAFIRHNELLDLRARSVKPASMGEKTGQEPPSVLSSGSLTLEANDLGHQPGKVVMSLAAEVTEWNRTQVNIKLPNIETDSALDAMLHVTLPDGRVASSSAIRLLPKKKSA